MTFGKLLKQARERSGKSITAAARDASVALRYWHELEKDEKSPTLRILPRIAMSIGCQTTDLIPEDAPLEK